MLNRDYTGLWVLDSGRPLRECVFRVNDTAHRPFPPLAVCRVSAFLVTDFRCSAIKRLCVIPKVGIYSRTAPLVASVAF